MSLAPLIPIAGSALGVVAGRALDAVKEGLSFLDVLHDAPAEESKPAEDSTSHVAELTALIASLREHFQRLGIDLSTPVALKPDGQGGVIVDGQHPERVLIESLFNSHGELPRQFNALAAHLAEQSADDEYDAEDFRLVLDGQDQSVSFE